MITERSDGVIELSFEDWSDEMHELSMEVRNLRPRWDGQHERIHDLGIDRLSHMKHGALMITLLRDHMKELTIRPDADEIMALGKALKRVCLDLDRLRQVRQAKRYHLQERKNGRSQVAS